MSHAIALHPARTPLDDLLATVSPAAAIAIADFVGWYRGLTAKAYREDLATFVRWCADPELGGRVDPLAVTRLDLERYARHLLDVRGNAHTTMRRRMQTLARFYALAAADGRIPGSPAAQMRLPSRYSAPPGQDLTFLDRYELARLLGHAKTTWAGEAALVALLGLMGLRVSEALALTVSDYQHVADGHRVLRFIGKGGKAAAMPVPVPVLRLLDVVADGRHEGPLLVRRNGQPYNYRAALRVIARLGRDVGIEQPITPHSLRRSFVSACLDAGVSIRDTQTASRHADPRMVMRYDRARHSLDRSAVYTVATFIAGAA